MQILEQRVVVGRAADKGFNVACKCAEVAIRFELHRWVRLTGYETLVNADVRAEELLVQIRVCLGELRSGEGPVHSLGQFGNTLGVLIGSECSSKDPLGLLPKAFYLPNELSGDVQAGEPLLVFVGGRYCGIR